MSKPNTELKTNAIRLLDQASIPYQLRQYEVDESDLSAESVAARIGMPQEAVFKTLITRGDTTGYLFALLPDAYPLRIDVEGVKTATACDTTNLTGSHHRSQRFWYLDFHTISSLCRSEIGVPDEIVHSVSPKGSNFLPNSVYGKPATGTK